MGESVVRISIFSPFTPLPLGQKADHAAALFQESHRDQPGRAPACGHQMVETEPWNLLLQSQVQQRWHILPVIAGQG